MKTRLFLTALSAVSFSASADTTDWLRSISEISAGDTTWVMVATILVLFMTIPGLALFYGGMVRKKNVLATMMASFASCCLIALIWIVFGYSFAFTPNNGFIGSTDRLFLH